MASSIQEIAFLDLTDIDEAERDHLQQVLYTLTPNLELPWEVQNEQHCLSQEFETTQFAVAPISHPTLRGVFLPQPLYTTAPAAVAMGLVPSVAAAEPPNGPAVGLVTAIDSLECNHGPIVASTTPPSGGQVPTHGSDTGDSGYPQDNTPVQMLSVTPSVSSSVPPSTQPVITTMYQMVGHAGMPLPNVYVGNVTANVNVHSFVGPPLTPYSPHISQQVFSPAEVPVPHESSGSPNAGRNSMGQRRARNNKLSNKRVEGQFGPRTPGVGHGHEVLAPAVVESPTGPPPLHQNYMIPVPSMHHAHAFHQPFYSSSQPPHGTPHLSQHPSAQHATGAPLFVPLFPAPMYNAYPQPGAGGPLMYSASPSLVSASVATTEPSSGIAYQVNDGPSERMMPEGRETEVTVHEQQSIYENEETSQLKSSVSGEEKMTNYIHDSDTESCTLASTVVVNNSNMVTGSEFASDGYRNEISNSKVPEQKMECEDIEKEFVSGKCSGSDTTSPTEPGIMNEFPKVVSKVNKRLANEGLDNVVEKKDDAISALHVAPKVTPIEKPLCDWKPNGIPSSVPKQSESLLPNTAPKANTPNSSPFARASVPGDSTPVTPVVTTPPEKTWASLFDKSSGSSLPADGAMIFATGMAPSNAAAKPLAAVRPFQNAVTVSSGSGDLSRKASDVTSMTVDGSKHFPHLGPPELPAPSMTDDPHLYRIGEFLSKYQLDHRAISLQPRGLTNRSNWCYINSTLQALLACPPFYNLMKSLSVPPRRSGKSSTPIIDSMVEFVNEFCLLSPVSRVNRKEKAQRKDDTIEVQVGAAFEPSYIYKMLSNIQSDTFKVEGRQEDAEEFFSCLLNALNDEMLELIKLVKDTSESNISNGDVSNGDGANQSYDEDDTEWKVMGKRNKGSVTRRAEFERTPVSDIFRGQLRSRVQRAGDYSDNVQPFFTLQLDIEKAQSVKEALELLVGRDQLEGVTCSRTNQEVEAWQQVSLEELPLVLVLHLKWFNYKLDGCSKIVKTVEFPIDLKFDGKLMSSYNKYNTKQKQYKLFAVVYHDGKEATKGHYITDVYHVGYGGWVRYDDSSVKAIQETQMLHPRGSRVPYLLYYRRCDTIGSAAATPDKSR